jgi:AraC-like DNA-binding protein
VDVLDDILASLRLNGGVVFDARTRGQWCIVSQFGPEDCAPYFSVPDSIICYHFVRKGTIWAQIPGQDAVAVSAGGMVLFPRNDRHLLYTQAGLQPTDIAEYTRVGEPGELNRITLDFGGEEAECYCGWLGALSGSHPLLEALPAMMLITPDQGAADWVSSSLRVAAGELNSSPAMVAKISELFFAQAVRRYFESLGDGQGGWLAGLRDPAVARALAVIHARYAQDLDVDTIAREAGLSRTVLGERFTQLLGEPPMRYCAQWRMQVAANRILDGTDSTASIAYSVGFGSEAAFIRAFKREYGEPPAAWKRRIDAEAQTPGIGPAVLA